MQKLHQNLSDSIENNEYGVKLKRITQPANPKT